MQTAQPIEEHKRAAGFAAVDRFVQDGMCVGLGTGSTARWAIERVGELIAQGARIAAVPTSILTENLCRERNIPMLSLMEREIAVAIDGADEVGADFALIKGAGGALFREKAVALAAKRFVVVVTEEKLVPVLGQRFPVPVEVVEFSADYVARAVMQLGAHALERRGRIPPHAAERRGALTPYITDNGNWILDCRFGSIQDPAALDERLRNIHGVVGTGLFVGLADDVIVAGAGGVRRLGV